MTHVADTMRLSARGFNVIRPLILRILIYQDRRKQHIPNPSALLWGGTGDIVTLHTGTDCYSHTEVQSCKPAYGSGARSTVHMQR